MNKELHTAATVKVSSFKAFISVFVLAAAMSGCDSSLLASAEKLKSEARQSLDARNFSDAARAAQIYIDKAPEDYEGYYLLAQAKAQTGDKNAALVALEQAIKKGLKDDEQIDNNPNLDPIKSMVAYGDLMKTSFPGRNALIAGESGASASGEASASVSITESGGKQVLRAGDIVIEMPVDE
jgi:hypothetical protein